MAKISNESPATYQQHRGEYTSCQWNLAGCNKKLLGNSMDTQGWHITNRISLKIDVKEGIYDECGQVAYLPPDEVWTEDHLRTSQVWIRADRRGWLFTNDT
ncbi:hypothetical protein J6590_028493 [Homalodisca vitripennis]|nr:hypothetical protein J6590_028493 [Homalodisca vitripennis]